MRLQLLREMAPSEMRRASKGAISIQSPLHRCRPQPASTRPRSRGPQATRMAAALRPLARALAQALPAVCSSGGGGLAAAAAAQAAPAVAAGARSAWQRLPAGWRPFSSAAEESGET